MTNLKKGAAIALLALTLPVSALAHENPENSDQHTVNTVKAEHRSFEGTIQTVGTNTFQLKTEKKGTLTVNTTSTTVFKKNGRTAQFSDLAVSQKAEVKGTLNSDTNTVTASSVKIEIEAKTVVGIVSAISGNTITVNSKNKKTYTVDATNAKVYLRSEHDLAAVADIQVGDKVNVHGTVTGTNVKAEWIRDFSQHSVAIKGTVEAVGTNAFTLQTKNNGEVTVDVGTSTTITKDNQTGTFADITQGGKVVVRGILDAATKILSAVKIMIVGK